MGLIVISTPSIFLSILLISSASLLTLGQQSPHLQETEPLEFLPLVLARKFRFLEEARAVKTHGFSVPKPNHKIKEYISGKPKKRKENEFHGRKGKGRKWEEEVNDMSSRLFTMDYAHVRRRRPVHNMSIQRP